MAFDCLLIGIIEFLFVMGVGIHIQDRQAKKEEREKEARLAER